MSWAWTMRVMTMLMLAVGACASSDTPSGQIDPDNQDPACHERALSIASAYPDFRWNEAGMGTYDDLYDLCIGEQNWRVAEGLLTEMGPPIPADVCARWREISGTPGLSAADKARLLDELAGDVDDPDLAAAIGAEADLWAGDEPRETGAIVVC